MSKRQRLVAQIKSRVDTTFDFRSATLAGLVAGIAFVAAMKIDNRLSGKKLDDLVLLGRPISGDPKTAALAGLPVHAVSAAGLGLLYAAFGRNHLPGPPAFRGALFALSENIVLYPFTMFEGAHPEIKDGQIDRYWSLSSHLWTVPRHLAYGMVLGSLYERLRDS